MKQPIITLLTDFGLADHYVAAMKGVILSICPQARLVDISHDVAPFAIPEAAYTLAQAWHYFPRNTTHLVVVDPGVGGARRAIVAEVAGHRFVAPDNGLLTMVLDASPRAKVRAITAERYFRKPVSSTFHGRDIFGPVAARVAKGLAPARLGNQISDPVLGTFARPVRLAAGRWRGTVLKIDRFGNIITNLDWATFHGIAQFPFKLKLGRRTLTSYYPTYSSVPNRLPFAIHGSSGYVEVSINQSHAASRMGVLPGAAFGLTLVEI